MQRNVTDEKKESSSQDNFDNAVDTLNQILALEDTTLIESTLSNITEYKEFCNKHHNTYAKAIDRYLDHPLETKWMEDCVKHCCAIPHKDTWRLLEKAITKNMLIAMLIIKNYPNIIQLYNSAKIKLNLIELMFEALPPSYSDLVIWLEKIKELSEYTSKEFFENEFKELKERTENQFNKFNDHHQTLLALGCKHQGGGLYVRPGTSYEYFSPEYGKLRFLARKMIMTMLSYEKIYGEKHPRKWTNQEVVALLTFFSDYYLNSASVEDICAIYDTYHKASFFNQRERLISIFSKQYPTMKIELIQLLQYELILKLNDTGDKTTEQLYNQAKVISADPLFSENHIEHGVNRSEFDKFQSYLKGLSLICENMNIIYRKV